MNIAEKLGQRLIEKNVSQVTAKVNSYNVLEGGRVARVIATLSKPTASRADAEAALSSVFEGKASPIPTSFKMIDGQGRFPVLCGFVSINTNVEPLTAERRKGMKEMARNVLMDEADNSLWQVAEDGSHISRNGTEDLSELLAMVEVASPIGRSYIKSDVPVSVREFVAFVDSEVAVVKHGVVVAKSAAGNPIVLCMKDDNSMYEIGSNCIVHALKLNEQHPLGEGVKRTMAEVETAGVDQLGATERIKEYFKQVYAASPEYFSTLVDLMNKYAAL